MRCLLLSSVLLCITACSPAKHTFSAEEKEPCTATTRRQINNATYSTQIDLFGKHFSGLTVFKATSDKSERVVFITEIGFKLFDFEFTPKSFDVKYIVQAPGKRLLIKTLQKDLGYVSYFHQLQVVSTTKTESLATRKCKAMNGKFEYYTTTANCTQLKKIEHGTGLCKSLLINFDGIKTGNPDTIKIADHWAHLKISLKQIDN